MITDLRNLATLMSVLGKASAISAGNVLDFHGTIRLLFDAELVSKLLLDGANFPFNCVELFLHLAHLLLCVTSSGGTANGFV